MDGALYWAPKVCIQPIKSHHSGYGMDKSCGDASTGALALEELSPKKRQAP